MFILPVLFPLKAPSLFSNSHIIIVTSHCVPTLGKDLKQDSQNIWNQFFVWLGGKKKNSVASLFLYWLRQKFNTMTLSQGKYVKGNTFWRRFFLVKCSKVYFNIVYLGIQILWVCYPRTCQVNVLTKKLTVNHLDFQKQNCNIWKVTLRAITCTSHLYNLNLFLCQWTKGIFHASPPFNFEILTVHCTGCIVSLDVACVFISFPNVFPRSLRIQGRKHRRTL